MLLSVLIPSLESRKKQLSTLLTELENQKRIAPNEVEILLNIDRKEKSTGFKRNELLSQAKGKYIVFIDDDDSIYPAYISKILEGCKSDCDCMGMQGIMTTDSKNPIRWEISKDFKDKTIKRFGRPFYLRFTNHISPVKREIAIQCGFPDKSNAEDSEYAKRLRESGLLKTEYKLNGLLYHYKFSSHQKEYK